jgi:Mn2+/Fe2+ NRAMP family transporter
MSAKAEPKPRLGMVAVAGPGLLLAATGVGGGDLATGSIVGSLLGTAVLWAVVVGAFLKYVVTEGLARWQLATGETASAPP